MSIEEILVKHIQSPEVRRKVLETLTKGVAAAHDKLSPRHVILTAIELGKYDIPDEARKAIIHYLRDEYKEVETELFSFDDEDFEEDLEDY